MNDNVINRYNESPGSQRDILYAALNPEGLSASGESGFVTSQLYENWLLELALDSFLGNSSSDSR